MTPSEAWAIVLGAVQGLGSIAVFLLALAIGVCLLFDWTKLRPTAGSRTVRSLDELVGPPTSYLPPSAPRGPSDQLAVSRRAA